MADQPKPISDAAMDAGLKYAMAALEGMPKDTPEMREAHLTGMLILFWGALWGTMGTDYARDFIAAQLRSIEESQRVDVFTKPRAH